MSNLGKTEKSILAIALLVLLAFSYFLYDDSLLFPKDHNDKLELIGNVATSQNDVRRKNLDTFSWLPASRQDKVFLNDSIFTGVDSEAQIKLQDGTIIRIQPNSLITLNMRNGQMMLDLRYGNLIGDLAKGSNLTIKSGADEFKLDSSGADRSQIQFQKSHSGNVDLKLLSGKVNYSDLKKKSQKALEKDKGIAVTPNGEIKPLIPKPTIELKTPANMAWMRATPDDPLSFEWVGHGEISRYEIEIAPTEDFVSLSTSKATTEMNVAVVDPLAPGPYFWRVKVYDTAGALRTTSEFRPMSVSNLAPPQITAPQKSAEFNYEVRIKSMKDLVASTELQWQANPVLKSFKWQVAADEQFTEVLKEGSTTAFTATTPKLPNGTYWVRVSGQTADSQNSAWSEAVPFTLKLIAQKIKAPTPPERPILVTTNVKFILPRVNERRPASEMAPEVEWTPVSKSTLYRVQVSKDMAFTQPDSFEIQDTKTLLSQINQPGSYYFRVFALGANGLISPSSDIGNLLIDPPLKTLKIPKLMEPFNNASIFLQTEQEPFIWLEWKKVAGASSYTLEISNTEDFSRTLVTTNLEKNRFLIKTRVPLGKIYWRVRAEKKEPEEVSDWAEKREFTIYHQKNETFVK